MNDNDLDAAVASSMRMTESLKADLVDAVGLLLKKAIVSDHAGMSDSMAAIIIITYLLGSKLGIDYHTIDLTVQNKLLSGIKDSDHGDQWFIDMRNLLNYLQAKRR